MVSRLWAQADRVGRCDPPLLGPGCFRRKRALAVSALLICLLTSQGNAFAVASHSLVYESSKGRLMSGRAERSVRSIGTDPVAFTEFYRAHVDEVTRFVARRVADPQLVADLTAEVFLAVIEAAARYRGSYGGPRTWLYGIARNVIAAEFRRSAREQRAESLIAGRRLLDADDVDRLMERIDAFRQVRELHEVLRGLPEGERAVLELVSVDGLTVAEAAAALNIRQVAARVRLHRARQALRSAQVQPILGEEVMS
jgi:RNA polymerase sigma-70 factor (ECF subfamily)